VLIDANLLIYSADNRSPHHPQASNWLAGALNGPHRVALPWTSLGAFLRVVTHPRIMTTPITAVRAWQYVDQWLALDSVWVPPATERTAAVLGDLMTSTQVTGNLVPDAMLAALAIEHGLVVATTDTDFGRFPDVRSINPLTGAGAG
jgi:toxin-antitoxin system PIN domain toxin